MWLGRNADGPVKTVQVGLDRKMSPCNHERTGGAVLGKPISPSRVGRARDNPTKPIPRKVTQWARDGEADEPPRAAREEPGRVHRDGPSTSWAV